MADTLPRTPETLAAGRELDALVAEKVMGWRDVEPECYTPSGKALCGTAPDPSLSPWRNGRAYVPRFSEDIGAAWQVVEHLRAPGWTVDLHLPDDSAPDAFVRMSGWITWERGRRRKRSASRP
jgi:hypothetical protein